MNVNPQPLAVVRSRTKVFSATAGALAVVVALLWLSAQRTQRTHLARAKQSEAKAALMQVHAMMSRHRAENDNRFDGASLANLDVGALELANYELSLEFAAGDRYVATARAARGNLAACAESDAWRIDQTGRLKHVENGMKSCN